MKIGFMSAILDGWDLEGTLKIANELGFECLEVACWPSGKGERRYAGVSHIDVDAVIGGTAAQIRGQFAANKIEISSLGFYPNPMDANLEKRAANIEHLKKVIHASSILGVNMVTTFVGRDQTKTVDENFELFSKIWPDIIQFAEEKDVKIAIENCPMLFGVDQWPGGQNLATSPKIWRKMFEIIPSDHFGLNFDPSHFVWQMMDYIDPIYEFKDKLFHVHFKDIKLSKSELDQVGVMAYPLEYMQPKIPGLGDVNWSKFVSALTDVRYDGFACIEVEDRAFESSSQKIIDSLALSYKYMKQFVI